MTRNFSVINSSYLVMGAKEPKPEKGLPPDSTAPEQEPEDEVDEAGEESFPASDSPPWTTTAAH